MTKVNIYAAKTQLSRLLELAEKGEEVVIMRNGSPIARLVPMRERPGPRPLGRLKGRIRIGKDFDAPLPRDVQLDFEGRE